MTQQSLITWLKAVEEALVTGLAAMAMLEVFPEPEFRRIDSSLSDLRELIKEAEGQTPDGEWITVGNKLYFALGEKP